MSNQEEINSYFRLWSDELDSDGNNYSPAWEQYRSPEAIRLLKERVAKSGSLPSISSFIIVFDALVKEGALRPVRAPKPVEKDFVLTREMYEKLPAAEIIRKFRSDPDFAAGVNQLIARGEI